LSLIEFYSLYDPKLLDEDSQDYTTIQTTQGTYRTTRIGQGATSPVSTFVQVSQKILKSHLRSIAEIFIDHVEVKGPKSRYREDEIHGLPGDRRLLYETPPDTMTMYFLMWREQRPQFPEITRTGAGTEDKSAQLSVQRQEGSR